MKIFYCHTVPFPGQQANLVNVAKMCSAMADLGHEVTIVSGQPEPGFVGADYASLYHIRNNISVSYLPKRLSKPRFYNLLSSLVARIGGADLVFTRSAKVALVAATLRIPVILEVHGDTGAFGVTRERLERLSASRCLAAIVVISNALAEHYGEAFPELRDRILVAHDGADPAPEAVNPRSGNQDRLIVGYAGHLYPGKGMEIIAQVAPLCPWADFEIVGGQPADIAHWSAQTAGLANLHFHGMVPHSEVSRKLDQFDVVLAPYLRSVIVSDRRTDVARWMSPLKIFEYMSSGKVMLASDLPVIREVLTDRKTAILCDPDQPAQWAAALRELADDPGLRQSIGETARQEFLAHYTWSRRAENILAFARARLRA